MTSVVTLYRDSAVAEINLGTKIERVIASRDDCNISYTNSDVTDTITLRLYCHGKTLLEITVPSTNGNTATSNTVNYLTTAYTTLNGCYNAIRDWKTAVNNPSAYGTVAPGSYGDITVDSTGNTWTVNAGVIGTNSLGEDITTAGKALLTGVNAAAQRTTLGLGNWSTLNYPVWATGTPFVKMTAAGTFALDTKVYAELNNHSHGVDDIDGFESRTKLVIDNSLIPGANVSFTSNAQGGGITIGFTGVSSISATSPITSSGGTTPTISTSMSTGKLIGRYSAGSGVMQEITIGTGLSLSGTGTLTSTISGLPIGGTTGQVLTKVNATDYNATWQDVAASYTSVVKHTVKNNGAAVINKGTPVYSTGSDGTNILVAKASNASEATSSKTMGLTQTQLTTSGSGQTGFVVTEGLLDGLNTAGTTAGDPVWLGVDGALIYGLTNKPYAPAHLVFIGIVTKVSNGNGEIFVKVQNGFELDELHNVDLKTTTPINGHILGYDSTLWVNKTIAGWLGYTPENIANKSDSYTVSSSTTYSTTKALVDGLATKENTLGFTPENVANKQTDLTASSTKYPTVNAVNTGLSTKEPTITAGTTSQYWRGDKSWQTLDKSAVGLSNVDNTSDANKPVSTATQSALNLKENTITAGTTSQYYRGDKTFQTLDKAAVGLSNVDNTSDATKNSASVTLTNKTISGANNTISNIAQTSITNLTTDLASKVNKSGDTMTGALVLSGSPTNALHAVTKDYVDTLINGIDWKQAVNAATISALPSYNVTGSGQILTGTVNGAIPSATTDGVALTINQRVLVKNETSTNTPNNGIYTVTQVGNGSLPFILTRTSDANTPTLLAEATVSVAGGSTLSNTQWHCNPASTPITIGSTNITFAQIGSGVYTAGSGLSLSSNVFSISSNGVTDAMIQSSSNWNTAYTNRITSLTTTGTSGAATLTGNTLNIPQYTTPTNLSLDDITASGTINILNSNGSGVSIPLANSVGSGIISASNYDKLIALSTSRQIPPLGSTGQVLGKISGTDYAVGWIDNVVDGSVTFAKMANISNNTLIGRFTAGTGSPESVGIGSGLSNTGTTLYNTLAVGLGSNQTVIGGLNASGTLTLSSTSNATKGNILFGNSAYDEVNNRLGIGTTTPTLPLHVVGQGQILPTLTNTAAGAISGLTVTNTLSPTSDSQTQFRSLNMSNTFSASGINFTGLTPISSAYFENRIINANNITADLVGVNSNGILLGSTAVTLGTVSNVYGLFVRAFNSFSNSIAATITNAYGYQYREDAKNTLIVTNQTGLNVPNLVAATNNTNVLLGTTTIPSGNWSIYNASTYNNYILGNTYIGSTTDSGFKLDVTGTARASTSLDTPIIRGGTTSGGTLTISSTSNATKGKILFGTSTYDEVNNRLGIGTTSPTGLFHAVGTVAQVFFGQRSSDNSGSANATFWKSRGTTSSPTIVQDGDAIGGFVFGAYDGSNFIETSDFVAIVDGTVSSTTVPQAIRFRTGSTIANRAERMRITSSGNILIGTSTDSGFKLDVNGTARASTSLDTPIVRGSTSASGTLTLSSTSDATKGKILFGNSAYDEANNRLGIGTQSPTSAVHFALPTNLSGTQNAMYLSSAFDATATGVKSFIQYDLTTTGSSGNTYGLALNLLPGQTGTSSTQAIRIINTTTTSPTFDPFLGTGNAGAVVASTGAGGGANYGMSTTASNSLFNIGNRARATGGTIANSTNVGVLGIGNVGTSTGTVYQIGGYFTLETVTPTLTFSAALACDNGTATNDIFVARDNGTAVFTIADGGAVNSTGNITVPDAAYGAGWNGNNTVPTKNAVYDKIESLVISGGGVSESLAIAYAVAL